jgi:hypothetical protein
LWVENDFITTILEYREVHGAESIVSINELVEMIGTILWAETRFVLVRTHAFQVIVQQHALWFDLAECDQIGDYA